MAERGKRGADHQLLMALACGATVEADARQADVSESTVYRRLAEPAFSDRLRDAVDDRVQRSMPMLTPANGEAAKTLLALLKEPTPPARELVRQSLPPKGVS